MAKASTTIDISALKVAGEPNKYITYINDEGIRVHDAGAVNTNFIKINSSGMQIYNGGQTDNYKVAEFGETIRIGKESSTYISIDEDSIEGYNSLGTNILDISLSGTALTTTKYISLNYNQTINAHSSYTFTVSEITQYVSSGDHFRITFHFSPLVSGTYTYTYGQSSSSVSGVYYNGGTNFTVNNSSSSTIYAGIPKLEYYVTQIAPSWTFGTRADGDIGAYSCVHGFENVASARYAYAEGCETVASGQYSHAEGYQTTASGRYSHAEGYKTVASGYYCHAEGQNTTANAIYIAHAEGYSTTASGYYSHAEGHSSTASGNYSHAQNRNTIAAKYAQTALGTYNIEDTSSTTSHPSGTVDYGQFALIIGNGTDTSAPSNALTVDWGGNVNIASGAKYKINGTALSASDVGAVPTSRTVNSKALSSNITLSASDVGAVPTSRTVNSKALSNDISLTASDVGAVPTTRTVNSKALSSNITLSAADVGALPKPSAGSVSEMGQFIDLRATGGATDYDVRLSCNAATSTGGGFLHINNQPMKDFVKEQSTSGSWQYRKWNSGKVEAWIYNWDLGSQTPAVWVSPVRYKDVSITIPSGIFSTAPILYVTSTDNQWGVFSALASSATAASIRFITAASAASTPNINIYAVTLA